METRGLPRAAAAAAAGAGAEEAESAMSSQWRSCWRGSAAQPKPTMRPLAARCVQCVSVHQVVRMSADGDASSSGLLLAGWFHFLLLSACVCRNISMAADIHRSCNAAWLCGTLNPDGSMLMHLGRRPLPAACRWCPGSRIEAESKPMEPSCMPAEPKPS